MREILDVTHTFTRINCNLKLSHRRRKVVIVIQLTCCSEKLCCGEDSWNKLFNLCFIVTTVLASTSKQILSHHFHQY